MSWGEWLRPVLFMVICIGIGFGFVVLIDWYLDDPVHPKRAACDRWVETLLTSDDLTEIIRAGIIVREVPCSLVRRLKAEVDLMVD